MYESTEEIIDRLEREVRYLRDEVAYVLAFLSRSSSVTAINLAAGAALEDHTGQAA